MKNVINEAVVYRSGVNLIRSGRCSLWSLRGKLTTGPVRGQIARGFSLIELLVVVLIIGILAAVALPQYQKAVLKSRFAGLRATGESIARGVHLYYMAQGDWPKSFTELDVTLPEDMTPTYITSGECRGNGGFYCCIMYPKERSVDGSVICGLADLSLAYQKFHIAQDGTEKKHSSCIQKLPVNVCGGLHGAKLTTNDVLFTPEGTKRGYVRYKLN